VVDRVRALLQPLHVSFAAKRQAQVESRMCCVRQVATGVDCIWWQN
jgi:hypothetical protein